jgi:hypothetical protein
MRRLFTYLLAAALFIFCVFIEHFFPQNMSQKLLSTVERNSSKEKQELLEDMKAVIANGVIRIELYSPEQELVGAIEYMEDFTESLEKQFIREDLSIKTINKSSEMLSFEELNLP